MSYLGKFYLCGPDAQKAADYLFTANTNCDFNKTVYTCMLNHAGGVEMDCTVTIIEPGSSGIVNPIFKEKAFYIGMLSKIIVLCIRSSNSRLSHNHFQY